MRPRVIIIGAGFGGLYAARRLGNRSVEVTVIDRRNFHLFQPLLYQVATGGLSPGDIASPIRAVLNRYHNVQVLKGEFVDLDAKRRQVVVEPPNGAGRQTLSYDWLIIATGVSHHYFGHPEWSRVAPGLKTIEDALEIRKRIFLAFEKAEWESNPEKRKQLLTFVIVGGGPTGVELCGALAELAQFTLRKDFRRFQSRQARILLLEAGERILPSFPPHLSLKARRALEKLNVEVHTGTMVTHIEPGLVTYEQDGEKVTIPAGVVLWAAGVKAPGFSGELARTIGAECDRAGRILVHPDLSAGKYPEIMVIGDMAALRQPDGTWLPGTAPVAMQQGAYAAHRILNLMKGRKVAPFRYKNRGNLAVIGRNAAVADLGKWQFSGFPAWLLWVFVHIAYLIEYDNKVLVLFQWAVDYFTRKKGARLITNELELSGK